MKWFLTRKHSFIRSPEMLFSRYPITAFNPFITGENWKLFWYSILLQFIKKYFSLLVDFSWKYSNINVWQRLFSKSGTYRIKNSPLGHICPTHSQRVKKRSLEIVLIFDLFYFVLKMYCFFLYFLNFKN